MTAEKKREYALMRYGIIAPAICHGLPDGMTIKEFLVEAANQTYTDPDGRTRRFAPSTIERWYYSYKKEGFDNLLPTSRSDCGYSRKIDEDVEAAIKYMKSKHPKMPSTEIYRTLVENGTIANGDISLSTLTRCVNKILDESNIQSNEVMLRYELEHINDVWYGDTCVGPKIVQNGCKKRVYIMVLIDDASRMITGAIATYNDNFVSLMQLIKSATLKYGIPNKLVFDNGAAYRNSQMELLAARIGTVLHFCRPRVPREKSKVERLILTLRMKWLSHVDLNECKSLGEIQKSLDEFVTKYNRTIHSSLKGTTPEDRFFKESERIRLLNVENADKIFLLEIERKVSIDCVVSIDNVEYEVDSKYSRKRVKLRYSPDMSQIYVVEANGDLTPIRLLNKIENSKIKRSQFYLSNGGAY